MAVSTPCSSFAPPAGVFAEHDPVNFTIRPRDEEAPVVTLHYFGMKGRAEVAKLILEEAALPYDLKTWWVGTAWKNTFKPTTPLGMLPVLHTSDGLKIAQSSTIVRYLADLASFAGGEKVADRVAVDMLYETALELKELKSELAKTDEDHFDLDSMIQNKAGNQRWGKLTGLSSKLERELNDAPGGEFFVGGALTYADLAVFNTLDYMEAVRPGCLQALGWPSLDAFRLRIRARPRISAYLVSARCFPFTELEICTVGYQSNGHPMGLKYVRSLFKEQYEGEPTIGTDAATIASTSGYSS